MFFRSLTLLTAFLMLAFLSGCSTDTKTVDEVGGNDFTANHFDSTATPKIIEGYVIRKDSSGNLLCGDCHKTAQTDFTINQQWADSAHAGHLLSAGVVQDTKTKFSAWAHYDWDKTFKTDGTDADTNVDKDRADCQQCHTSTGNVNFMKTQVAASLYDPALNDFSHLSGWSGSLTTVPADQKVTTSSSQNELLYCWGCHSSVETGALLAPLTTGIKPGYKVDGVALQLPPLGTSNACVGCHSGRGNIQSLLTTAPTGGNDPTVLLTTSTVPKSTATATATHYKNAAATIFHAETKVGYEFPLLNYADPSNYGNPPLSYLHKFSNCIACHMTGEKSHSFSVTEKDPATGVISVINSQDACNGCHSSLLPMSAAKLEESREGYEESLHILEHELVLDGYVFVNAHPYFYVGTTSGVDLFFKSPAAVVPTVYSATATDRNGDTVINGLDWIDANADNVIDAADLVKQPVTWATQGDIGAGHNFNYLHHEPGAYAHNRFYAKRLIFDSIDWLDNGNMDGQITIDADTYPEAAIWFETPVPASGSVVVTRP